MTAEMQQLTERTEVDLTFIRESALVLSARFYDQVNPFRTKLPQFIYVASFSCNYGTASKHDWLLQVIQYDSRFHRLVETTVQFGVVDERTESFFPLPQPAFLNVQVMKAYAWYKYGDEIYQALVGAAISVTGNKPVEGPKHGATGHPLLPNFTLGPCYSQK